MLQKKTNDAPGILRDLYIQSPETRQIVVDCFRSAFPDERFEGVGEQHFVDNCWQHYNSERRQLVMNPNYPSGQMINPSFNYKPDPRTFGLFVHKPK